MRRRARRVSVWKGAIPAPETANISQVCSGSGDGWKGTYGSPDDVGNLHEVIVDNVGKVVGGKPITFHEDKVLLGVLLLEAVVDNIFDDDGRFRAPKPYSELFPVVGTGIRFCKGNVATCAWVVGRLARLRRESLLSFQCLWTTETPVGLSFAEKPVGVVMVERQSLRLR